MGLNACVQPAIAYHDAGDRDRGERYSSRQPANRGCLTPRLSLLRSIAPTPRRGTRPGRPRFPRSGAGPPWGRDVVHWTWRYSFWRRTPVRVPEEQVIPAGRAALTHAPRQLRWHRPLLGTVAGHQARRGKPTLLQMSDAWWISASPWMANDHRCTTGLRRSTRRWDARWSRSGRFAFTAQQHHLRLCRRSWSSWDGRVPGGSGSSTSCLSPSAPSGRCRRSGRLRPCASR